MVDVAVLETRLAEAESALHNLQMGTMIQKITQPDGKEVVFTPANINRLVQYCAQLNRQLGRGAKPVLLRAGGQ